MATFPLFIALVRALLPVPLPFPPVLGLQLRLEALRENLRPLCLGLSRKNHLVPCRNLCSTVPRVQARRACSPHSPREATEPPRNLPAQSLQRGRLQA